MKQKLCLFITAFLCIIGNARAQNHITANPFYSVKVKQIGNNGVGVQAFVAGRQGDTILIIGGRIVGLHNFSAPSFPDSSNNHNVIVYIPSATPGASKVFKMALPKLLLTGRQYHQLSASNTEYAQSGSILYCVGGFGYTGTRLVNRARTPIDSFITFNNAYAINVPGAINAVLTNNPVALVKNITFAKQPPATDSSLAVTGGEMVGMGNYFYLAVGQKFNGEYGNNIFNQTYTCKITQLQFNYSPGSLSYSIGNVYSDPINLHRRDLNVVPAITSWEGGQAIDILGGVFTPTANGGPYLNPVEITINTSGQISENVDNSMVQCFNQYSAAHILIYDSLSSHMMTTILGGISLFSTVDSANNNLLQGGDTSMPWVNVINTIVRDNSQINLSLTEYASDNDVLPGLIGAEAKFIPYSKFLRAGSNEIIDFGKVRLAAASIGPKVSIGYLLGGIISTTESGTGPTSSNVALYSVSLDINDSLLKPGGPKKGKSRK